MNKDILVAGSILSADLSSLKQEIVKFQNWGLPIFHIDVMDGNFVPNLTFGPVVFEGIKGCVDVPVDIHLMVENPMDYLDRFAEIFNVGDFEFGMNWYGIHLELYLDESGGLDKDRIVEDLSKISQKGFLTTLVLNPDTGLDYIQDLVELDVLDKVLVMTVWPGFSGQEMIVSCLEKAEKLVDMLEDTGVLVAVDGGVNDRTIELVKKKGVDFIVSGSYLMKAEKKEDFVSRLDSLG